ncbi:UNVERIFIED_CONTAM: hypothetical protein HDU68_004597 [Siphonaria sp. JEL0065]|nr:hypothetical protein HDU68_004597 [Siphonaria sp. JEL0065]
MKGRQIRAKEQTNLRTFLRTIGNRRILVGIAALFVCVNVLLLGPSVLRVHPVYGPEMFDDLALVPSKVPPPRQLAVSGTSMQYLLTAKSLQSEAIPVIVIGCNRVAIARALDALIKYRTNPDKFPIIVSLDCGVKAVKDLIMSKYGSKLTLWTTPKDLHQEVIPQSEIDMGHVGYYKLSTHYKWALEKIFSNETNNNVIILEGLLFKFGAVTHTSNNSDDMEISPDFFSYFEETLPLLYMDPTLFCISSWNDQGKKTHVSLPSLTRIMRTDFFPGLGWLLTRNLYTQIAPTWPETEWDDWLRRDEQRKGRQCIIPEVSRNRNFGSEGVSGGQFFDSHIALIAYAGENDGKEVDFSKRREVISHLANPVYENLFERAVYEEALFAKWDKQYTLKYMFPTIVDVESEALVRTKLQLQPDWKITLEILSKFVKTMRKDGNTIGKVFPNTLKAESQVYSQMPMIRVEYESVQEMREYLFHAQMMAEIRSGMPRSGCKGVTQFVFEGQVLIFIAPSKIARHKIMNANGELLDENKKVIKIMHDYLQ